MTREFNISDYPNSDRALHLAHRAWVPDYRNPYNLILTFAEDVSEQQARKKYSQLICRVSKLILKNAYTRRGRLIDQHGYLEYGNGGRYHIHALCDVREDWADRFIPLVRKLWTHGIETEVTKVPTNELARVHAYNSKMQTKKSESGRYADSYLVV